MSKAAQRRDHRVEGRKTGQLNATSTSRTTYGDPKPSQPERGQLFTAREIADLVKDLGRNAEAVCRRYLSNGKREGNHWRVGDLGNNPGRSLYVRLKASGNRAAGKWTDYVAARVMLRSGEQAVFFGGSAASPQHNPSLPGRIA
jgi:hypothetical protein